MIPDHLLRIPRTHRGSAVLHIDNIKTSVVSIDQIAPNAPITTNATKEERGQLILL